VGNPAQTETNAAGQATAGANQAMQNLNPILQGLTSGFNMPQLNSQVFQYLLNPQGTNLAQSYPGLQQYYSQEMQHGLSPAVINNAMNNNQVQNQQTNNSMMNQFGASMPNQAGSLNQMQFNDVMGTAQLGSNLAAQNQGAMTQGATGLQGAASALDSQTMQMLTAALSGGQNASQSAAGDYSNIFGQYNQSAQYDTAMASQLQQQQANMWASLLNGVIGAGMSAGTGGLSSLLGGLGGGSGAAANSYLQGEVGNMNIGQYIPNP
jgi:hypothetical protein